MQQWGSLQVPSCEGHSRNGPWTRMCNVMYVCVSFFKISRDICHERAATWIFDVTAGATTWHFHTGIGDWPWTMQVSWTFEKQTWHDDSYRGKYIMIRGHQSATQYHSVLKHNKLHESSLSTCCLTFFITILFLSLWIFRNLVTLYMPQSHCTRGLHYPKHWQIDRRLTGSRLFTCFNIYE